MVKEPSYEAMVLYNKGDRVEISEPRITRGRGKVVGTVISGPDESETYMVRGEAENSKAAQLYGGVHGKFLTLVETPVPDPEPTPPSAVDHPSYYGGEDNPYEAIKVIEAWGLDFHLGNVVKYVSRAGKKNPDTEMQDLEKALWYLERAIESRR